MGAWGSGIFENDATADFLWEYEDGGVAVVLQMFEAVHSAKESGYVDADIGSMGLAAAEVVAASHGHFSSGLDEETAHSLVVHDIDVKALSNGPALALNTVATVASTGDKSELFGLWAETSELENWLDTVNDLTSRLKGIG